MYLLFIDESGTTDLKKENVVSPLGGNTLYFTLGAVLLNARQLEAFETTFELLRRKYFKKEFTEIKYSVQSKKMKNGVSIKEYRSDVYKQIAKSSVTLFGVGMNKFSRYEDDTITSRDDTYQLAFQHLIQLINAHVVRKKLKEPITVFIDSIDDSHDTKMYQAYKLALKNKSLMPNFDKSIFSPSLNFAISKFTVGLQIADLVAGSLWRGLEAKDKSYSNMIKKRFPASDNGNPYNYGYVTCSNWKITK